MYKSIKYGIIFIYKIYLLIKTTYDMDQQNSGKKKAAIKDQEIATEGHFR